MYIHCTWNFCVVFIGSCIDKSISVSAGVTSNIEYLQVYMNAYDTLHMVFQVVMGCHGLSGSPYGFGMHLALDSHLWANLVCLWRAQFPARQLERGWGLYTGEELAAPDTC